MYKQLNIRSECVGTHSKHANLPPLPTYSVTRLGEISPIWQNLQSLGPIFEGLFIVDDNG